MATFLLVVVFCQALLNAVLTWLVIREQPKPKKAREMMHIPDNEPDPEAKRRAFMLTEVECVYCNRPMPRPGAGIPAGLVFEAVRCTACRFSAHVTCTIKHMTAPGATSPLQTCPGCRGQRTVFSLVACF